MAYGKKMKAALEKVDREAFYTITDAIKILKESAKERKFCLLYTSPSPRDQRGSRMPSSA